MLQKLLLLMSLQRVIKENYIYGQEGTPVKVCVAVDLKSC